MKKLLFIASITALTFSNAVSQIIQKSTPVVKQNVIIKTDPNPPPPVTSNKTAAASNQNAPVYSLTAVKVNIRTGNDNKEYPSSVRTTLGVRGSQMEYSFFVQENLKNEMKSNSNTEYGLEKRTGNLKDITLDVLQNTGVQFRISYYANLLTILLNLDF